VPDSERVQFGGLLERELFVGGDLVGGRFPRVVVGVLDMEVYVDHAERGEVVRPGEAADRGAPLKVRQDRLLGRFRLQLRPPAVERDVAPPAGEQVL
jgi:hypothetical protein